MTIESMTLPEGYGALKEFTTQLLDETKAQTMLIEMEARGSPPDQQTVFRQAKATPVFDDLQGLLAGCERASC